MLKLLEFREEARPSNNKGCEKDDVWEGMGEIIAHHFFGEGQRVSLLRIQGDKLFGHAFACDFLGGKGMMLCHGRTAFFRMCLSNYRVLGEGNEAGSGLTGYKARPNGLQGKIIEWTIEIKPPLSAAFWFAYLVGHIF